MDHTSESNHGKRSHLAKVILGLIFLVTRANCCSTRISDFYNSLLYFQENILTFVLCNFHQLVWGMSFNFGMIIFSAVVSFVLRPLNIQQISSVLIIWPWYSHCWHVPKWQKSKGKYVLSCKTNACNNTDVLISCITYMISLSTLYLIMQSKIFQKFYKNLEFCRRQLTVFLVKVCLTLFDIISRLNSTATWKDVFDGKR